MESKPTQQTRVHSPHCGTPEFGGVAWKRLQKLFLSSLRSKKKRFDTRWKPQEIANAYVQMYRTYVTEWEGSPLALWRQPCRGRYPCRSIRLIQLIPKVLGRRLQDARKARGLTQQDAANDLGIARTDSDRHRTGERRVRPENLSVVQIIWTGVNNSYGTARSQRNSPSSSELQLPRLAVIKRNWSEPSRSINNSVKITSNLNDCAVLH